MHHPAQTCHPVHPRLWKPATVCVNKKAAWRIETPKQGNLDPFEKLQVNNTPIYRIYLKIQIFPTLCLKASTDA